MGNSIPRAAAKFSWLFACRLCLAIRRRMIFDQNMSYTLSALFWKYHSCTRPSETLSVSLIHETVWEWLGVEGDEISGPGN
ncbi:hypothetical protein NC652_024349 [Populus alba x Populus x berolinensis]|nr:hypothetical protein NC652_024349 [Populus alba x Populus x berolinensis]